MAEQKNPSAGRLLAEVLAELEAARLWARAAGGAAQGALCAGLGRLAVALAGLPPWPSVWSGGTARPRRRKRGVLYELQKYEAVIRRTAKQMRAGGDAAAMERLVAEIRALLRPAGIQPAGPHQARFHEIAEALQRIRGRSKPLAAREDARASELLARLTALEAWLDAPAQS